MQTDVLSVSGASRQRLSGTPQVSRRSQTAESLPSATKPNAWLSQTVSPQRSIFGVSRVKPRMNGYTGKQ